MNTFTLSICLEHYSLSGDSCCNNVNVPLTTVNIKKIISLGYKLNDFVVAREYFEKNVLGGEKWWIDSMVKKGKKFYKINTRRKQNGNCFFLKEDQGCILGNCRPEICKIYPFWLDAKNKIIYEVGETDFCILCTRNYPLNFALKLMNETPKSITTYFNLIKSDCIKNKEEQHKIILELLNQNTIQKTF
jgi:Fe-S-cluster containining protein